MKRLFLLPALITAFTYMACSDTGQESSLTAPNPSFTVAGNPVVASASGAGDFEANDALRTFSFTAQRQYDGTVDGQFQVNNRASGITARGSVTCIRIAGSTARIGGVFTNSNEPFFIGQDAYFTVIDNGEGKNSPADEISFLGFSSEPNTAASHCAAGLTLGLNDITSGNIQVGQRGGGKNEPPTALNDNGAVFEDGNLIINVLANDSDPEGDVLSIESVSAASFATVTITDAGLVLLYTPDEDFFGTDTFTYTISDGNNGGTSTASVTVTVVPVADGPVATDDAATTDIDTAVVIDVVANDVDPDGGAVAVTSVGNVANGTVVINGDGTVTFTPAAGFEGTGSFDYTITSAAFGLTDTATVTVDVVTLT